MRIADLAGVVDVHLVDQTQLVDVDGDLGVEDRPQLLDHALADRGRVAAALAAVRARAAGVAGVRRSLIRSFRRRRRAAAVQRRAQRVPRERRTLHAHRELPHAAEDRELAEALVRRPGTAGSEVTRRWKPSNSFSTSSTRRPFTPSVISEAEAVEIAQPEPSKAASFTTPSSTVRKTVSWSPHRGLWPSAERFAAARPAEVPRRLVVIEDHRLVELAQVGHQAKTSRTLRSPRTRASTSACVL